MRPWGGGVGPVVAVCLVTAVVSGCGVSAELDRERDPVRTAAPVPDPRAVGTEGSGPLRIEPPGVPPTAPSGAGAGCPASGLRFGAGPVNAAMGLRAMTLTLTNCGSRPYELDGRPRVAAVLGPRGAPIGGVRVVAGTDEVPMAPRDPDAKPFTLAPGERASAGLYWRMAAEDGVALRVAPGADGAVVTLRLEDAWDIGPRNTLGVGAWRRAD
ncbi:DUF4232 domain-containing protein [Streptomyces sp. NPDC048566]|uniref:DUF4232 domain-containing protein n=1 Tax=Streptomyces sp. NPDC048566 TaxID=3365569 RepID=UPI0037170EC8